MQVVPIIFQTLLLSLVPSAAADSSSYLYGAIPSAVGYQFSFGGPKDIYSVLGFDVRIFQYDLGNMDLGRDVDFMASEYTNRVLEYSLTGVKDINFAGVVPETSTPYGGALFGREFDVSNFVAEFTTYFFPQQSGFFKFELLNTDDSAMFFLGAVKGFQGCKDISTFDLSTFDPSSYEMFTVDRSENVQYYYQYLEAYKSYPIRIIYSNMASDYSLQLQVTYPDGSIINDFDNNGFLSPSNLRNLGATCGLTTVTTTFETVETSWTGSTESYSTYYPTGTEQFTAYYYYPDPTTTVSSHYFGSTISSTVVTPTGAGTWTEAIFYPEETVTSYFPWTGATAVTSTTLVPEDPEIPATVVIGVPDERTTTTHLWTGTETSSTTIYPVDGNNGTVTIEVLIPESTVASTTSHSDDSASTYPPNVNGTTTAEDISRGTKTLTEFWSSTFTSFSTEYQSELNNEITVHEFVPQSVSSDGIVYITTYWTGSFISYSTINPGYSNGTATVLVNIPQQTITETWSGTVTSTSLYCPYSGAASTPIVLVPSSAASSIDCEICGSSSSSSLLSPSAEVSSPTTGPAKSSESVKTSTKTAEANAVSSGGFTYSSMVESSNSLGSTATPDIEYSNNGNRLIVFNFVFALSILFAI